MLVSLTSGTNSNEAASVMSSVASPRPGANGKVMSKPAARAACSLALIAPLGFFMGMPFPLGLRRLAETAPAFIPWAWAINGFASVLSTALAVMLAMASIAGGLWGLVPAFLKIRLRVNEIIVTLMLNYIAILILDYLVYGPWKDPKGFNFPLTAQFSDAARLTEYFDTRLHSGFLLALFCALVLYLFMERTVWGYEIKVIGSNPKAAKYAGMNTGMAIFFVLFLSGAIAGIAGFGEVAGLQHRLQHGISPGYGYTAIIIAWLAKRSALGVVIVSFLMGVLLVGGDSLQLTWQLPVAFVYAFQGLILFFLLASDFFIHNRLKLVREERHA